MGVMLDTIGQLIAGYLQKEVPGYEPFTPSDPEHLRGVIEPGDVLLVEGNNRISGIIKYLTQSTRSHAALYVGPIGERTTEDGEPLVLVEANLGEGVVGAPLSKYDRYHTRICRPIGLTADDCARVCTYAAERIGFDYDVKNIIDLLRYLIPLPVPQRWRGLYALNPMVGVIENFRRAVLQGVEPDFHSLIVSAVIAVIVLPIAYLYFKKVEATMADII